MTLTTRLLRRVVNSSVPAALANSVSSLPMPTPSPGLNRVPRWRTMISPPLTYWPAKTLTPRRWASESRPLREEPRPFLCAIRRYPRGSSGPTSGWSRTTSGVLFDLDVGDFQAGELLPVTGELLVAPLGLELEDPELRVALVTEHLGGDRGLGQRVAERDLVGAHEHGVEVDGRTLVGGQALLQELLALLDAVLLRAGLDDCVQGKSSLLGCLGGRSCPRRGTAPATSAATAPRLGVYRVVVVLPGRPRARRAGRLGLPDDGRP